MKFVFLMDPLETVKVKSDTSFILMVGAFHKGHEVYYLPKNGISLIDNHLQFRVFKVTLQQDDLPPFIVQEECRLSEEDVDVLFIRTDPPFDYEYLMHTWLLERLSGKVAVINDPHGIRTVNEKVWASQFTEIVPSTFIGRYRDAMIAFVKRHKKVVVKPTDGFGGQSIFLVSLDDPNFNVILESVTHGFARDVVLQEFVPTSKEGDKRILLLNGEPLGAVLRLHSENDHRNNFYSGGKPLAADITRRDLEIIGVLKPEIKRLGLYFVGIDILGDYLIEVNVTSPTCLQEMNRLYDQQLQNDVIDFSEKLSLSIKGG